MGEAEAAGARAAVLAAVRRGGAGVTARHALQTPMQPAEKQEGAAMATACCAWFCHQGNANGVWFHAAAFNSSTCLAGSNGIPGAHANARFPSPSHLPDRAIRSFAAMTWPGVALNLDRSKSPEAELIRLRRDMSRCGAKKPWLTAGARWRRNTHLLQTAAADPCRSRTHSFVAWKQTAIPAPPRKQPCPTSMVS